MVRTSDLECGRSSVRFSPGTRRLKMSAVEARFEESGLKCYQFGESFRHKEVIRSTVVLKKDANFLPPLASH